MITMRRTLFAISLLAGIAFSEPVSAVPVYVTARWDDRVSPDLPVFAFSYDVKRIFPGVQASFDASRPVPPVSVNQSGQVLQTVPTWTTFHLIHAVQLQDFRESFARAHSSEKEILRVLMPRFDGVYRKYGDRPPEQSAADVLASEDSRQMWCQNVTRDLNLIITSYNAGIGGGEAANSQYREAYARWLSRRDDALRQMVARVGGNANLGYIQSNTNEGGVAIFDIPPGRWFFACQFDALSWYKSVIVPAGGGRVTLKPEEATHEVLNLSDWTGG